MRVTKESGIALPRSALVVLLLFGPLLAHGQEAEQARAQFLSRMVAEHHFEPQELETLFADVEVNEQILQAISRPAERVLKWHEYQNLFITEERVRGGVEFWTEHGDELRSVSERYGVPPEILVAIVGIETRFGTRMGRYKVLEALSTLAFAYPPRARFFANELEAFLLLAREERFDAGSVLGSYAGAMGGGQFIPTSFQAYAVDEDGDGIRDLWNDWDDVLGSVANYFKAHGWQAAGPVAERATRRAGASASEPANSMDLNETIGSLTADGYVFATDQPASTPVTVLGLEGRDGREYWVGYHNFRVITRYNRSVMYALVAKQLADAIASARPQGTIAASATTSEDPA